ncbi:MAG TPA: hypothetical protein VD884_10910 [Ohtaekwangia sp.]|nr:hypothetical protein [Ohtaekwangia sp.]
MKQGRLVVAIIIVLLNWPAAGYTQDCLSVFRQAYGKMKNFSHDSHDGLLLKYSVHVETTTGENYSDFINLEMRQKRVKVVSSDFTVFQDEKTMVVIQPEAKVIFMTRPVAESLRQNQLAAFMKLQDSIYKYMKVRSCGIDPAVKDNGGNSTQRIMFQLPIGVQEASGVTTVTYWVDASQLAIKRLKLTYGSSSSLYKAVSFHFDQVDDKYVGVPFDGSALSRVMEGKSRIKERYRHFEMIDQR